LALRDLLEDPALPFARVVAAIDPLTQGGQLLASQLLRHGPRLPLNSIVCALPALAALGDKPEGDASPIIAALCLGGEEFGAGSAESGCMFGRAVAVVERGAACSDSWPLSVASLALQVAAVGTEVEDAPGSTGRWIFHPPSEWPEPAVEESPPGKQEGDAEAKEEGQDGDGGEQQEPIEAGAEGEEGEQEKPTEPEKPDYTAARLHGWLFNGLNECFSSDVISIFSSAGAILENEARACKEWLAKTEKAGFWGPVVGVRNETAQRLEDERKAREEARREAARQRRAEKKRMAQEAGGDDAAPPVDS
jgi:hypothetical protein